MPAQEVSQLIMDANTITTITSNINSLYSNAISQLTSYTFGVIAVVGVLMPIIVSVIQSKSLKAEKENLEKYISDEVSKIKSTLRNEISNELMLLIQSEESKLISLIEQKYKILEDKLECANARSFHLQGNSLVAKGYYAMAVEDFCASTKGYLKGSDELNGQRTLRILIQDCLTKINKDDYESNELDESLDGLQEFLAEINQNSRYSDQLAKLGRERKTAKNRNRAEKTPQ
jgi:hypothetical protein